MAMRAARLYTYDPEARGPEFVRIEEVPEPTIESPDDVIVRVGGAGVCRTDLHIVQGLWDAAMVVEPPYILGHENAGWVAETGPAVRGLSPGDPVVVMPGLADGTCDACRAGLDNRCEQLVWQGIQLDGGFAELLRTKPRNLVPLPPGLEPKAAAPYADAGLTAYHAVNRALADLVPGSTAVVIGVGGLGHVGVQVLRALTAARILAVDASPEALALAGELGADMQVEAGPLVVDQVRELTGGAGAHVVLDFFAEQDVPQQGLAMLRTGGLYVVIGYGGDINVPAMDVMATEKRIVGCVGGTYLELKELLALSERGAVTITIREYPFEKVNAALADLAAYRIRGRGVLVTPR
jgi:NAD+-dependent secondary alcohol dehydrogenase Adh1